MTVPRVSLIVLRARDVERTLEFYRALGLKFVEEKHGSGPVHFSSTLGSTVVEVYPARSGPEPDRRAPGATMLGFAVESLDVVLAAVRAFGVRVLTEPKDESPRRAVVEDPDARAIEITEAATTRETGAAPSPHGVTTWGRSPEARSPGTHGRTEEGRWRRRSYNGLW
ncbi:MAG TPA: VOC family protein [Planctomycetota bacterium]|nr:VOC family protein [Planctomycetota bacterium]